MGYDLSQVFPWGRSFDEYVRMFNLGEDELAGRILGCADGPASFNAELHRRGGHVVSCDPLYQFSRGRIQDRIDAASSEVMEQTERNVDNFVWTSIPSLEGLRETRMTAMNWFLEDYDEGKREGRYIDAELPVLPFDNDAFDLALCSHFLFLYSEHLALAFHQAAITELCRVAKNVRIFPVIDLNLNRSAHLNAVRTTLEFIGLNTTIERVPYEFQRGGNEMLHITH